MKTTGSSMKSKINTIEPHYYWNPGRFTLYIYNVCVFKMSLLRILKMISHFCSHPSFLNFPASNWPFNAISKKFFCLACSYWCTAAFTSSHEYLFPLKASLSSKRVEIRSEVNSHTTLLAFTVSNENMKVCKTFWRSLLYTYTWCFGTFSPLSLLTFL